MTTIRTECGGKEYKTYRAGAVPGVYSVETTMTVGCSVGATSSHYEKPMGVNRILIQVDCGKKRKSEARKLVNGLNSGSRSTVRRSHKVINDQAFA